MPEVSAYELKFLTFVNLKLAKRSFMNVIIKLTEKFLF